MVWQDSHWALWYKWKLLGIYHMSIKAEISNSPECKYRKQAISNECDQEHILWVGGVGLCTNTKPTHCLDYEGVDVHLSSWVECWDNWWPLFSSTTSYPTHCVKGKGWQLDDLLRNILWSDCCNICGICNTMVRCVSCVWPYWSFNREEPIWMYYVCRPIHTSVTCNERKSR